MKRIAIKVVVFLLLGAVVNVGVAWGCIWLSPTVGLGGWDLFDLDSLFLSFSSHGVSADRNRLTIEDWSGVGSTSIAIDCSVGWSQGSLCATKAGWPVYSLRGAAAWSADDDRWITDDLLRASDPRKPWRQMQLPLRPILPGFLFNTLFYALVLWLLWSAPFATRRLIRRRRGRCMKCGYDLRYAEHEVCPECGAARYTDRDS